MSIIKDIITKDFIDAVTELKKYRDSAKTAETRTKRAYMEKKADRIKEKVLVLVSKMNSLDSGKIP